MASVMRFGRAVLACSGAFLLIANCEADAPAPAAAPAAATPPHAHAPRSSPVLFGMGAQPCKTFLDVSGETTSREIALSGAMFSWAQGWFSARNVVGHESAPRVVGGTVSSDKLKSLLVEECKGHPVESLYLAINELYDRLAKQGL
jgi:hypothetical protein